MFHRPGTPTQMLREALAAAAAAPDPVEMHGAFAAWILLDTEICLNAPAPGER